MFKFLILPGLCLVIGFGAGWKTKDAFDAKGLVKTAEHTIKVQAKQAEVSQRVALKDQAAQIQIKTVTRTITKEIPVYVTAETDARFPLSNGFVRVHDAAVSGRSVAEVPDPAGKPDDAASDVTPSQALGVIVGNVGQCRADQERLVNLQDWVTEQAKAFR